MVGVVSQGSEGELRGRAQGLAGSEEEGGGAHGLLRPGLPDCTATGHTTQSSSREVTGGCGG